MRVLFDQGTLYLSGDIFPAMRFRPLTKWAGQIWLTEICWKAESQFDLIVTTDQNLRYQQNLKGRNLAILVLPTTSWPEIQNHTSEVASAVSGMKPGDYLEFRW